LPLAAGCHLPSMKSWTSEYVVIWDVSSARPARAVGCAIHGPGRARTVLSTRGRLGKRAAKLNWAMR
jgi:hypothetical protein